MFKKQFILFFLFSSFLFASTIVTDYKQGLAKAKAEKKLVALTVIQTSCPWCTKFKNETLKDATVSKIIEQNFVHIMLNRDTQEIPSGVRARLVPSTFFLNANGEKVSDSATGFFSAEDFRDFLEDAIKKGKK